MDLELTHQFLTQTYKTLYYRPEAQIAWRDEIFQLALQRPPLLDGLLATAAIHKIMTTGKSSPALEEAVLRKQTSAVQELVVLVGSVDSSNYRAFFALSALVTFWAFCSERLPGLLGILDQTHGRKDRIPDDEAHSKVMGIIRLFNIVRPLEAVFIATASWVQHGNEFELTRDLDWSTFSDLPEEDSIALGKLEKYLEEELGAAVMEEEYRRGSNIRQIFRLRAAPEWAEFIVAWPVQLPDAFFNELKSGNHAALTALSYWAVCFRTMGDRWWAKGLAEDLVAEIAKTVDGRALELVQWPLCQLGLSMTNY